METFTSVFFLKEITHLPSSSSVFRILEFHMKTYILEHTCVYFRSSLFPTFTQSKACSSQTTGEFREVEISSPVLPHQRPTSPHKTTPVLLNPFADPYRFGVPRQPDLTLGGGNSFQPGSDGGQARALPLGARGSQLFVWSLAHCFEINQNFWHYINRSGIPKPSQRPRSICVLLILHLF